MEAQSRKRTSRCPRARAFGALSCPVLFVCLGMALRLLMGCTPPSAQRARPVVDVVGKPCAAEDGPTSKPRGVVQTPDGLICYTRKEVAFLIGKKKAYRVLKKQHAKLLKDKAQGKRLLALCEGEVKRRGLDLETCQKKRLDGAKRKERACLRCLSVPALLTLVGAGTLTGIVVGVVIGSQVFRGMP